MRELAPPGSPAACAPGPVPERAVLDTNVVLDWLVFADPRVERLAALIVSGRLQWLATPRMHEEFGRVLLYKPPGRRVVDRKRALAAFERWATPSHHAPLCSLQPRDPDDQIFIDLAVASQARWLLTHDRALLRLAGAARKLGIHIATPSMWAPE